MTKQEALKEIDEKVSKAAKLVREAQQVARENGIPFRTGIISAKKFNEETGDHDLPLTGEEDRYADTYTVTEAGWAPSGLNC